MILTSVPSAVVPYTAVSPTRPVGLVDVEYIFMGPKGKSSSVPHSDP